MFLALWPDAEVRARLAAVAPELHAGNGRLIAPSNLHITLIFLGACDSARRGCVERVANSVTAKAFDLVLTSVQWRRRGGIVWLAPQDTPAALMQLVQALAVALDSCGVAPDPRPYRPHVTIARDVKRFGRSRTLAPIIWRVQDYCLVCSTLARGGSSYTPLRRWPLC